MKKRIRAAVAALGVGVAWVGCASDGGSAAPACACKSECTCGHCASGGKDACTCSAKKEWSAQPGGVPPGDRGHSS